jgi:hypothetical protein
MSPDERARSIVASMDADDALKRAFDLGMDADGWTDAVMDEAELLLPILLESGYAARDEVAETWWFTENGVARHKALEDASGD